MNKKKKIALIVSISSVLLLAILGTILSFVLAPKKEKPVNNIAYGIEFNIYNERFKGFPNITENQRELGVNFELNVTLKNTNDFDIKFDINLLHIEIAGNNVVNNTSYYLKEGSWFILNNSESTIEEKGCLTLETSGTSMPSIKVVSSDNTFLNMATVENTLKKVKLNLIYNGIIVGEFSPF